MKNEKTKVRITFNEWAIQLRVSTMWDDTKIENRNFIERLTVAREYYFSSPTKG